MVSRFEQLRRLHGTDAEWSLLVASDCKTSTQSTVVESDERSDGGPRQRASQHTAAEFRAREP